jgi:hypothetical protein
VRRPARLSHICVGPFLITTCCWVQYGPTKHIRGDTYTQEFAIKPLQVSGRPREWSNQSIYVDAYHLVKVFFFFCFFFW